jgi:hypothetical protein
MKKRGKKAEERCRKLDTYLSRLRNALELEGDCAYKRRPRKYEGKAAPGNRGIGESGNRGIGESGNRARLLDSPFKNMRAAVNGAAVRVGEELQIGNSGGRFDPARAPGREAVINTVEHVAGPQQRRRRSTSAYLRNDLPVHSVIGPPFLAPPPPPPALTATTGSVFPSTSVQAYARGPGSEGGRGARR